ncbi:MAG: thiamine pyrophosphate-binding protein [Alphaproteobacteria bacterium]|nr:thiamine pyrophosphate-binding protein [Alphaproteobacteria bacterium]
MSAPTNTITGRAAFLSVMKDEGVKRMFGNPGTTELPIMHALTDEPDIQYTMALQESVVVAMADGYARASGELVACNVHVAPGLGNAMGTLFTAANSGTPMILTAGQQEQGHGLQEPLLYGPLVEMAAPVVKWSTEITQLEDLPRVLRRAAKVAMTAPTGPVFISLPGDILNSDAAIDLGRRTRVDTSVRPSDAALDALADRLLAAKNPVVIAGTEIVNSDAFAEAVAFVDALGAPVFQQTVASGAHFPSEHPAFIRCLGRSQPDVRKALEPYDLLVCLGADVLRMSVYSEVDPLPEALPVIQIGLNDWEMGKNYPAEMALRADLSETLAALTPLLKAKGGAAQAATAAKRIAAVEPQNWTSVRAKRRADAEAKGAGEPVNAEWLMMRMSDLAPRDVIVVDEGVTSAATLNAHFPFVDRYSYFGNVSGGIGWGIAAAVGVQMAQPERRVVAVIGDGSAQYSIQALWTAANMKAPVVFVICNNDGYRIIRQRLKLFHGNEQYIGMNFSNPSIDAAKIAEGYGMESVRVSDGAAFEAAFAKAIAKTDGPTLIEAMVA